MRGEEAQDASPADRMPPSAEKAVGEVVRDHVQHGAGALLPATPKGRRFVAYSLLAIALAGLVAFTWSIPNALRQERIAAQAYLEGSGASALLAGGDPRLAEVTARVVPKGVYVSVVGQAADRAAVEALVRALRSQQAPVPVRVDVKVGKERVLLGICSHPPAQREVRCPACEAKKAGE